MGQIDDAIRAHEDRCSESLPNKFVPWTWVVGICITIIMTICGATWAITSKYANILHANDLQDAIIEDHGKKIMKLENVLTNQEVILLEIRALRKDINTN
jgi:hypothetical protein